MSPTSIVSLLVLLVSFASAADFSDSSQLENREYVTVCPTDGHRAVRVDPENTRQAQIVATNCATVQNVAVSETNQLDLSRKSLDLVLSYPDAETLNLAFNALDYFPLDASVVTLRSLILRGNLFRSLADVEVPTELEYLDLSYCQVTTLGNKSSYPQSLVKLRLAGNQLSSLRDMAFPKNLRAIELDHQGLLSLEGAALPSSLEILTSSNVSLTTLNASSVLPDTLVTIDVSSNMLTQFPDFYAFPSLTEVNASFNAIVSIIGVQFPWTLKRLDLRGNPLAELEIARSDLKLFQAWSYHLPKLNQSECRNPEARKVKLTDVELCVLEDADFYRIYDKSAAVDEAGGLDAPTPTPENTSAPDTVQNVNPATKSASTKRNPLTWAFLIISIVVIAIVITGVISTISWKHQQLRRQVQKIMDRNSHIRTSSFNDDLLRAVGLEGELIATRFSSEEIKILHVLGKSGYGLVYLAAMRNGEPDGVDDADVTSTPKLLLEGQDRRSAISELSLQDLETESILATGRQLVALKRVVPEHCTPKSPILRAFVEEIQLMAQLDHPKIISFLGVYWNTLSDVTMVLEYLSNGDLRTMLRIENDRQKFNQSRRLHWNESRSSFASTLTIRTAVLPSKCAIALNVADALVYLHSLDPPVLHRELRSKHVLFGEHYETKLSGIGAPSEMPLDLAKTAALDSVAWIAPEILRGERYSAKADIYALGILLTELATGQPPFPGLARAAVVVKVAHEHERPHLSATDCPDLVQHLAQLCLSADPRARPTAHSLRRELAAMLP